jgi:uncharacterized protein YbaR (Trm112 family)
MPVDPSLLELLACPAPDHGRLVAVEDADALRCTECGRVFEVVDGIPKLVLERDAVPDQPPQT